MTELLKFFWLLNHRKEASMSDPNNQDLQFHCAMHREMHEIDDMWHTFLLFTQDYAEFSMNYFGYFLHHSPNTEGGDHESEAYKEELTKYLSYIYDHLGEKTLRTWFAETLLGEFV